MGGTKVAISKGPNADLVLNAKPRHNTVKHNRLAFFFSAMIMLNLASMPMKSYFTERLPWTFHHQHDRINITNITTLQAYQVQYNQEKMPRGAHYYFDSELDTQILRHVLYMKEGVSEDRCLSDFLLGLPGVIFFGSAMRLRLCAFAGLDHTKSMLRDEWNEYGQCMNIKLLTINIGQQCVWINTGNQLDDTNATGVYTLTYVQTLYPFPLLLLLKFMYRVTLTGYICTLMWTNYYRHYYRLVQQLKHYGHRVDLNQFNLTYELLIGDPTAMVLINTRMAMAFLVDIFFSVDTMTLVLVQASQAEDFTRLFLAFMYISRVVWIAYTTLGLTSYCLKKLQMEQFFSQMDPTMLAIIVAFYGPFLAWCWGDTVSFLEASHYLLECLIEQSQVDQCIELCLVVVIQFMIIGLIPVLYGFCAVYWRKFKIFQLNSSSTGPRKIAPQSQQNLGSFRYNNLKDRALLTMAGTRNNNRAKSPKSLGGTLYMVLQANPRYKQCPTISGRSADCFLLYFQGDEVREKVRLSLLRNLDRNLNNSKLAIHDASNPSVYVINQLQRPRSIAYPSIELRSVKKPGHINRICVARSQVPSEWCM